MNILIVILMSFGAFSISPEERANSVECMNWTLRFYPEIRNRASFIPEHNILVETVGQAPNQVRLIHSEMGSFLSRDNVDHITCNVPSNMFGGQQFHGYYQMTALALSKLLRDEFDLSTSADAGPIETFRLQAALRSMPRACAESHISIKDLVKGYCEALRTRPALISGDFSRIRVCR